MASAPAPAASTSSSGPLDAFKDPAKLVKTLIFEKASEDSAKIIRLIGVALLGVHAVLGLVFPGLLLGFFGAGFFPRSAVTDIFQVSALFAGALAYLYFKSEHFDQKAKEQVTTVVGFAYAGLAIWNVMSLKFAYELSALFMLLHIPINGAVAILHLKQAGLIKQD